MMKIAIIVVIAFYFLLFFLGYAFGKMDKKSNEPLMSPLEIKYTRCDLKQWVARKQIDKDDFQKMDSNFIENYVARTLADKFVDVIKHHMIAEKDYYRGKVIYSIEIWLKGDN